MASEAREREMSAKMTKKQAAQLVEEKVEQATFTLTEIQDILGALRELECGDPETGAEKRHVLRQVERVFKIEARGKARY